MKLVFHKQARRDLVAATRYYADVNQDLGEKFNIHIQHQIEKIMDTPYLFKRTENDLRQCKVNSFPYIIYYQIKENTIRVMLIKHEKRDPTYGFDRR